MLYFSLQSCSRVKGCWCTGWAPAAGGSTPSYSTPCSTSSLFPALLLGFSGITSFWLVDTIQYLLLIGWHSTILASDWLTLYNTYFWLVYTRQYLLLIGWHNAILTADWFIQICSNLWLVVCSVWYYKSLRKDDNGEARPVPHFYSIHSWLGLGTMGLFALQVGFINFHDKFVLLLTIIISSCIKQQT